MANVAGMAAAASDPAAQMVRRSRGSATVPRQVDPIADLRDPGAARGTAGSTAAEGGVALSSSIGTKVSLKQLRHLKGRPEWTARGEGSYLQSMDDAQAVLDAVHSGSARVLGTTRQGHVVVEFKGVTGFNNNPAAGFVDQPTNVFMIKGTAKPSVVPTSPAWKPPTSP